MHGNENLADADCRGHEGPGRQAAPLRFDDHLFVLRDLELARRVGTPKGSRAVGLANGSNPIAIVVPCHRVIGSNGKLTGYGGGLDNKQTLLALERQHAGVPRPVNSSSGNAGLGGSGIGNGLSNRNFALPSG